MLILTKFRHGSTFPQILSEILLLIYQQHNRSMFLNMLPTLSKQRLMILVRANTITALHLPTLMNTATDTCTCSLKFSTEHAVETALITVISISHCFENVGWLYRNMFGVMFVQYARNNVLGNVQGQVCPGLDTNNVLLREEKTDKF